MQKKIWENNWRQGIVVYGKTKDELLDENLKYEWAKSPDVLILFSQNCDLTNNNIDKEPFAEFFCASFRNKLNKDFQFGKNPRKLSFQINSNFFIELDINHRIRIDRKKLQQLYLPKDEFHQIDENNLYLMLSWLSKKYTRPAFPAKFNNILTKIPKLKNNLKDLNKQYPLTSKLFFYHTPIDKEVDIYELEIIILLEGNSDDEFGADKIEIQERVERIFNHQNLIIKDIRCLFENEMTVLDLRIYKLWDLEYITYMNS